MASKVLRKQYIVDKVQYKMLIIMVIYILGGILLAGFLIFFPSFMGLSAVGEEQYAAAKEVLMLHRRFWPAILIVIVILGGHSIFIFHRIFGPLYRFKVTMKDISQGDLSYNIKIRKNDFLNEEEDIMNDMITSLRNNLKSLKTDNALLVASIGELHADLEDPKASLDTVREKAKEIQQKGEKLNQGFKAFKTENSKSS